MHEVGCLAGLESSPKLPFAMQSLHDLLLAATALLAERLEQLGCFGVGVCGAT